MIAIDTSSLIAIINHEPERHSHLQIIAETDRCLISAVSLLETRIVTFVRFGTAGVDRLDEWFRSFEPEIVAFDETQATLAFEAYQQYGKGIHPQARLNFGDCAAYAVAKSRGVHLLFKGSDFSQTDIVPALTR